MKNPLEYYDEAYFERGWERGTAYSGYKANALSSGIFKNVAEAIVSVFRPLRCLEIGCATGPVVFHLNALGCETHGIDVSKWAIENREHPNVQLAPAHELPFEDGYFDLVFSLHSLEHIPVDLKDASFAEISRVSRGGTHFHMLPILGDGPYQGDEAFLISELQKDPTHSLLHNRRWWLDEWKRLGWNELPVNVVFSGDTETYELSRCQFILSEKHSDEEIARRAFEWNREVARILHERNQRPSAIALQPDMSTAVSRLEFSSTPVWWDLDFIPESSDFRNGQLQGIINVYGEEPITLRIALLNATGDADVTEGWLVCQPGANLVSTSVALMGRSRGALDLAKVGRVLVGGEAANTAIECQLVLSQGAKISQIRPKNAVQIAPKQTAPEIVSLEVKAPSAAPKASLKDRVMRRLRG